MSPVLRKEKVGSRVTCSPAPQHTDDDTLVLVKANRFDDYVEFLEGIGWTREGGNAAAPSDYGPVEGDEMSFASLRKGNQNYIVTASREFFSRFMAATSVAKRLNVLKKADRIALFQAVLYGNPRYTFAEKVETFDDPADQIPF